MYLYLNGRYLDRLKELQRITRRNHEVSKQELAQLRFKLRLLEPAQGRQPPAKSTRQPKPRHNV
jgi:hypothetical protein